MRAARMHGYKQPLVLEEIPIPDIGPPKDVNHHIDALGRGDFVGRAVIVY